MDSAVPRQDLSPPQAAERPPSPLADQMVRDYVGYLAGWFEIAQLAAGRRLHRSGVREPLLSD